MAKRTWRQVRQSDGTTKLVEISPTPSLPEDLRVDEPFVSPVTGEVVKNKYDLHDHNRRNGVVQAHPERYQDVERVRKENLDRAFGKQAKQERIEQVKRALEMHHG